MTMGRITIRNEVGFLFHALTHLRLGDKQDKFASSLICKRPSRPPSIAVRTYTRACPIARSEEYDRSDVGPEPAEQPPWMADASDPSPVAEKNKPLVQFHPVGEAGDDDDQDDVEFVDEDDMTDNVIADDGDHLDEDLGEFRPDIPLLNTVILTGRLGQDPVLRHVGQDDKRKLSLLTFSLAVRDEFQDGDSEDGMEPTTSWFKCEMWGQQAELGARLLRKGLRVGVTGQLGFDNYKNKEGVQIDSPVIMVRSFEVLQSRSEGIGDAEFSSPSRPYSAASSWTTGAGGGVGGGEGQRYPRQEQRAQQRGNPTEPMKSPQGTPEGPLNGASSTTIDSPNRRPRTRKSRPPLTSSPGDDLPF